MEKCKTCNAEVLKKELQEMDDIVILKNRCIGGMSRIHLRDIVLKLNEIAEERLRKNNAD